MHVDDSVKTMKKDIIMSNTVRLHRVFNASVERVYRAFVEPDALVKWMAPHGFTAMWNIRMCV